MTTATIKLFLVHGDARRLRVGELSNWTGKAIAGPRSEFEELLAREEAAAPGIYLLTGSDPESGQPTIYIGEAESIRDRLKAHLAKDFWNHVVYFVSKDENLTKAHIRYLEGKLIDQARIAARAVLHNGQGSGAKLPESDRADLEIFLEKINQLLPVLGVELLVPPAARARNDSESRLLRCEIKGLLARGHLAPNGFIILAGSQAVAHERASTRKYPWANQLRLRLKAEGTLAQGPGHLFFTRDAEFSSPSAAAAVVHGGSANGLTAWKDQNGRTLKEIESA